MCENNAISGLKSVAFRITDICNLNCSMCGQAKNRSAKHGIKKHWLELDEIKKVIDQVEEYRPQIYIWGGEPFMYGNLSAVIEYISSKKLNSFITTNGVLLNEFIKPIVDCKVAEIAVSLDGFEEFHEKIRGVKGIYSKVLENLLSLKEYKKEVGKVLPIVDIHTVVVKDNYRTLYDFVKFINEQNLCRRIRIQLPMFFTVKMADQYKAYVEDCFGAVNPKSWYGFVDDYSDIDIPVLNEQLDRIRKEYKNVLFFPAGASTEEWFHKPEVSFKGKCMTCRNRINIEPDGSVIACTDFPETKYGNILEHSIEELFNNSIITRHRENTKKGSLGICSRCSYFYVY